MTSVNKPWEDYKVVYKSDDEWVDTHQRVLFVGCSEPTMRSHFEKLAQEYLHLEQFTRIIKGGGAGTITLAYPYFFATRSEIAVLNEHHKFVRAVGLVHWRCGYYHTRYTQSTEAELFSLQKKDLHEFHIETQKLIPNVSVETYYAYPHGDRLYFARIE